MTEQEWLAQSDKEKSEWVGTNIIPEYVAEFNRPLEGMPKPYVPCFMNWQGFGMIVEKIRKYEDKVKYETDHSGWHIVSIYTICDDEVCICLAHSAWEAAALAYGKMKGLIK